MRNIQPNQLKTMIDTKKTILIILAIILSLVLSEPVIKNVLKYPTYGLQYKVHYRIGAEYWTNVWKPHSKYWNVEGGNVVYSRNNLGFPGKDVNTKLENRIAVLGSSYLEAYQINPDKIACSVFSDLLSQKGMARGVYNLGCSGHDPYDSYMRLAYYETKIKPQTVILVINSDNYKWFQRHPKPFRFEPDRQFGETMNSLLSQVQTLLRNSSSLAALYINALKPQNDNAEIEQKPKNESKHLDNVALVVSNELMQTLENFKLKYPNFIAISILNDSSFNDTLKVYCASKDIAFFSEPLIKSENMLHGAGHLNENGNRKLGEIMCNSYWESIKNGNDQSQPETNKL